MADKKEELDSVNYTLGILSIVLAFFQPLAGLILGIIGFVKSKDQKTELGKKAKKFCLIGMVLSAVVFIITVVVTVYSLVVGTGGLSNFPIG